MKSNQTNGTQGWNELGWNPGLHSTLIFLGCLIVLANTPVILLFLRMSSLRSSVGNIFLFGLAVADMLCALVMIPAGILCEAGSFSNKYRLRVCRFYYITSYTISIASVYHIVAATIAKYFAIVYPMRNLTMFTKSRVKYTVVMIWSLGFLAGHLPIYWPYLSNKQRSSMIYIQGFVLLVFAFVIPVVILVVIHVHIYKTLNMKRRPQQTALTSKRTVGEKTHRAIVLFLLLFLVFLISWLPWYLIGAGLLDFTNDGLLSLRFSGPVLNPLVFTFMKRDFRRAVRSVFLGLRGKQRNRFSIRSNNATKIESSLDNCRNSTIEQNQSVHDVKTTQLSARKK